MLWDTTNLAHWNSLLMSWNTNSFFFRRQSCSLAAACKHIPSPFARSCLWEKADIGCFVAPHMPLKYVSVALSQCVITGPMAGWQSTVFFASQYTGKELWKNFCTWFSWTHTGGGVQGGAMTSSSCSGRLQHVNLQSIFKAFLFLLFFCLNCFRSYFILTFASCSLIEWSMQPFGDFRNPSACLLNNVE